MAGRVWLTQSCNAVSTGPGKASDVTMEATEEAPDCGAVAVGETPVARACLQRGGRANFWARSGAHIACHCPVVPLPRPWGGARGTRNRPLADVAGLVFRHRRSVTSCPESGLED